jgi:glycosyltransferase involved in cell wall biosynthesis
MASKDERVILPGFIYGQGYRELLAHASCYVQATEVGGTHPALLEAMGAGNCVIANGTAENIEVLEGCGITYRKNDPGDLARLLTDVLGNSALAREMGEKARERVANEYNWDTVALRYHELFVRMRKG